MRRRGTPIVQMQTAVFAVLTVCSIVLVMSTVKLGDGTRVAALKVTTKALALQSTPQDSFAYVVVMLAALSIIVIASAVFGLNIAGITIRVPTRLAAMVALGWSWILLVAIAAPAALPCGRGVAKDPWHDIEYPLLVSNLLRPPPAYFYNVAPGPYVNLCSLNTQQSAHAAMGFAGLAIAATLVPALAVFVATRVARLAWTPATASSAGI
jgi:hypothetical protein